MKTYRSQSISQRLRRQRRRTRRWRGWLRLGIGSALAVGFFLATAASLKAVHTRLLPALEQRLAALSWLQLKQVHLISSGVLERRQLLQNAGLKEGMNLWQVSPQAVIDKLSSNPLVRRVTVERKFPNELLLKVEERSPRALLRCRNDYYQIDLDGTPYQRLASAAAAGPDLPLLSLHPCAISDPLIAPRLREGMALLATLTESSLVRERDVSELAFEASQGWTVLQNRAPRQIHWGPAEEGKKLLRLRRVLADLQHRYQEAAGIDLDFKNRVIVRLAGPSAVEAAAAP